MIRKTNGINAGSMADIAFLLLIFFLVTSTMDMDVGIRRKLPPPPEGTITDYKKRNIFAVWTNKNNKLMVEGKACEISQLKSLTKEFLLNPANNKDLSEKKMKSIPELEDIRVSKGIVSVMTDRGTSYATYIQIQNELASAYHELRNEFAIKHFGIKYKSLTDKEKIKAVQLAIPLSISEAEPQNTGGQ